MEAAETHVNDRQLSQEGKDCLSLTSSLSCDRSDASTLGCKTQAREACESSDEACLTKDEGVHSGSGPSKAPCGCDTHQDVLVSAVRSLQDEQALVQENRSEAASLDSASGVNNPEVVCDEMVEDCSSKLRATAEHSGLDAPRGKKEEQEKWTTRLKNGSSIQATQTLLAAWWKELSFMLVSIVLIAAIGSMLGSFRDQPQPTWARTGLNVSTLLAILATILRSSLVLVAEEVMSQAKWLWLRDPHPLQHLSHFDNASRGPWGSLILYFRVPRLFSFRSLRSRNGASTLFCGCVTIGSLAIGSFTQQAVRSVGCIEPISSSNASLIIARDYFSSDDIFSEVTEQGLSSDAKGRILNALSGSTVPDRTTLLRNCDTGNCTFKEVNGVTHTTNGFCSKCLDTTPFMRETLRENQHSPINWEYIRTLPNNLTIGNATWWDDGPLANSSDALAMAVSATAEIDWAAPWLDDALLNNAAINMTVLSNTMVGCTMLSRENWTCAEYPGGANSNFSFSRRRRGQDHPWNDSPSNAVSGVCVLYPCRREMRAKVENGRLDEVTVRDVPLTRLRNGDPFAMPRDCLVNNLQYTVENMSQIPREALINSTVVTVSLNGVPIGVPDYCAYGIDSRYYEAVQSFLTPLLTAQCNQSLAGFTPMKRLYVRCTNIETAEEAWWLNHIYNSANATFPNIQDAFEAIASAITDSLRLAGVEHYNYNSVQGIVNQFAICTEFKWPWLLFPAVLVFLTCISLLLIMFSTSGDVAIPVWKSSILPALHFPKPVQHNEDDFIRDYSIKALEKKSKKEIVALCCTSHGWQLTPKGEADTLNESQGELLAGSRSV